MDGRILLTDSTHVKANASFKANTRVFAQRETTDYMERLDRYEAEERVQLWIIDVSNDDDEDVVMK